MNKILISACLLGDKVRYDGGSQFLFNENLQRWHQQGRLVSICPEVSGGLSIPRDPAEIQHHSQQIITVKEVNVTAQFLLGAESALKLCQHHNIRYAIMKESSPSCGSTKVYDGSFSGSKIAGEGITSALLRKHGIAVYSEETIAELVKIIDAET